MESNVYVFYRTGKPSLSQPLPAARKEGARGGATARKAGLGVLKPGGSPISSVPTAWFESAAQTIEVRQVAG